MRKCTIFKNLTSLGVRKVKGEGLGEVLDEDVTIFIIVVSSTSTGTFPSSVVFFEEEEENNI